MPEAEVADAGAEGSTRLHVPECPAPRRKGRRLGPPGLQWGAARLWGSPQEAARPGPQRVGLRLQGGGVLVAEAVPGLGGF